jgi:exodeoxyribonuclease VII small subunit
MVQAKKKAEVAQKNYSQLQIELDEVMGRLESGELTIDEAIGSYEVGLKLVRELEKALTVAENRIIELKATYKVGE